MMKDLAIYYKKSLPGENMSYFVVDSVFVCKVLLNCKRNVQ